MKKLRVFCLSILFVSGIYGMDERRVVLVEDPSGSGSGNSMQDDSSPVSMERERQYATVHNLVRDAGNLQPDKFKQYLENLLKQAGADISGFQDGDSSKKCDRFNHDLTHINYLKKYGRSGRELTPIDVVNDNLGRLCERHKMLDPKYGEMRRNYTGAKAVLIARGARTKEQLDRDSQPKTCCVS